MKKFYLAFIIALLTSNINFGQNNLKTIDATSTSVDIKEDGLLKKNQWSIVPEENPDIYKTSAKNITFYTDKDSISYTTKPNGIYDFIILLNKKDSAYTRIVYEQSKLDILKNASKYNYSDNRFVPEFTYQNQENSELIKVRKDLKLDSIAGSGSELAKIFNLMHWVHNVVRHDGNSDNPKSRNAIDLVKVCKEENRGLNCRMMSTILNDCYLAMGMKSRQVTCMPKETKFEDCHVINMVYSTELNKWIWMDPTFNAYVMDGKGNLLGIEEVRQKLINDEPLILNADANWNRTDIFKKEDYLDVYMAKNLYRLRTPTTSEYDFETWKKGKAVSYIELLPLDGIEQTPQKKEELDKLNGVKHTYYITNNPDVFWEKSQK